MNEKDLLIGLNHIDEALIEQAEGIVKRPFRRIVIRWVSAAAAICLLFTLLFRYGAPLQKVNADDLMLGITPRPVETVDLSENSAQAMDFMVRLFQTANESGKNTLVSPLSVLYALSMTANGAQWETLAEMESVLGMDVEAMNAWLYSFSKTIDTKQFHLANSIWFSDHSRFLVNQKFLQTNADYYGADIYKKPFDQTTVSDINNWVNEKTDGMIPSVLDEIPEDAVMYLINALCFDAKWARAYAEDQVSSGVFTTEEGVARDVEFLRSAEPRYLEDGLARGFMKYYEGNQYAFVAMLPNEGVSVEEYLASLTGEKMQTMLNGKYQTVIAAIPKFEMKYETELSEILKEMGMEKAFDPAEAEFGGLGIYEDGNIAIDRVVHNTYISLDDQGTRAGASTMIGMTYTASLDIETIVVTLDRPFVYMIIDTVTGIPLFIGTMMDPAA